MTVNNQLERGILHRNKNILAPMVRCGTLPLRLTCLDYGAGIQRKNKI
jgi:tRNA-dihydrouridine synthase